MKRLQVGQKVRRRPVTLLDEKSMKDHRITPKLMPGTVVYIHPQGRYHVVEFQFDYGTVREAFFGSVEA